MQIPQTEGLGEAGRLAQHRQAVESPVLQTSRQHCERQLELGQRIRERHQAARGQVRVNKAKLGRRLPSSCRASRAESAGPITAQPNPASMQARSRACTGSSSTTSAQQSAGKGREHYSVLASL